MKLIMRLVATVALMLLSAASLAQINYYSLVDSDNNPATGCAVTLPTSGTVAGIERRLTASVSETAAPQVTQLALENCVGGSFGAPVALPGVPYSVGSNDGTGGADTVELAVSAGAIATPGATARLYFAAQGPTSDDLLGATSGPPVLFGIQPGGGPADIPFLSGPGFLMLVLLLLGVVLWQRSRLPGSVVGVLLVGTLVGIAWAAGFRLDGQVGDWQGVSAVGSDAQGDSAPNTDIVAAFAAQEGGNLFFRTDIANAETSPSTNQPPAFTSTPVTAASVASPYSYAIATSDPDGNALTLTAPTLPAWLTFTPGANGAGALSGTPGSADLGPHSVVLRVTDNGTPSLSTDQTFTITVGAAANPAPVLDLNGPAAGIDFAATFTEGGGAVPSVDPANLTVVDPDSLNLATATVTLTNPLDAGQETLAVSAATVAPNTSITAVYNAATGALTLTGAATLAQYQAALRTVTYNNSAAAPTATPARVITFAVSDGSNSSTPATATVTVASVNDAPGFTAANPPAVNEDSGPQTVSGWVTAFNPGPADESAQTVLAYTVSNISNSALFSAPPSVNTNGNLSYTPASNAFGTSTFEVRVQDNGGTANGGQDTSAPQTFTITVNGINDQPSFVASNPPAVNENAGAQTVPGWATFSSGNSQESAQTVLAYTVSSVSNAALFSVQPSVAANGNLTYTPAAGANGTSTFSVAVQDSGGTTDGGVDTSTTQTFTITVNPVNDPPTITGQNLVSTAEDTARTIAFTDLTVTDPDNTYPTGFTLTVSDGANYTHTGNTITPALDFAGTLTVPVIVNDGADNSNTFNLSVTVTAVNDAPVNTVPGAQNIGEDVVLVFNAANSNLISISDVDVGGSDLAVTLSVTTGTLTLSGTAALNFTVGDGTADATMTFTGALAAINTALDGLSFQPPLDTTGSSTLTLTTDDQGNTGAGVGLNDIDTVTITITAVNDAPVIANLAGDTLAYTQGEPASVIDQNGDASASDIDSLDFDTGTLTVSLPVGVVTTEDQLGIRNQGSAAGQIGVNGFGVTYSGVTIGSFSGGAGGGNLVVTFNNPSADATAVSALLRNITYLNSNNTNPSTIARTARFVLTDGDGGTSIDYDATITVALNDPPVVTTIGGVTAFTENGPAVIIDGALTVTDTNDTDLESATVTITNLLNAGVETLSATTGGTAITATYAAPTLTLTGTDTVANYQAVLRSVTYNNTSQNPNETARIIRFVANDGSADSAAATKTVSVTGVNDTPSFAASNPPAVNEDVGGQSIANWATFSPGPADESTQTVLNYTVSGVSNAALFSVQPSVDSTGTLTYTPAANANGTSNFTVTVRDNGGTANGGVDTSTAQTFVITVNPVNDVPSFTAGPSPTVNEDAGVQIVNPWATASAGPANESGQTLTFSITGNTNAGLFSAGPAVASNGTLTFTPAPNANGSATITVTLSDNGGTLNGGVDTSPAQTFTITVTPVNDPPSVTPPAAYAAQANMQVTVADGAGDLLDGSTITDVDGAGAAPFALTAGTVTSANSGSANVTLNANGSFTYNPPPGFAGTDTFVYQICDSGVPGSACTNATATVNVSGPVIWFVNTAGGAGNGTLFSPFNTLGGATTAMGSNTNQRIFVFSGIQALGTGVTLPTGGWLIGQGVTGASFDAVMGITPPAGTIARPSISGAHPTIRGTVSMNGNNTNVRGLLIQPGSGTPALQATLAGPFTGLVVSDIPNITATSARAVNLNNVSGTFTIQTVNASATDIGINLNNVNPSTGSFTVTGNGGSCSTATPTCSGGTISNVTNTGIQLNNTRGVSLTRMRVANSTNFGLNGTTVTNLDINTSLFDGTAGNAVDEGQIFVTNWFGSGTISNSEITGGFNDNVRVNNTTSGTLNRLTVSNTTIRNSGDNHGFAFYGCLNGSAGSCPATTMNLSVLNSTFTDNSSNSVNVSLASTTASDVVLQGNLFQSTSQVTVGGPGGSVLLAIDHSSTMTLDVDGNTFTNPRLSAFTAFISNQTLAAASMVGKIRNNIIGVSGDDLSGSRQGSGMQITATGAAAMTLNVIGNTIRNWATNNGVDINAGDGVNGSPNVNLTITGNTLHLDSPTVNQLHGISANMGTTSTGSPVNACVDIGGTGLQNNVTGSIGSGGGSEIRVRQRFASNVRLPGFGGPNNDDGNSASAAVTYLIGRNTGAPNTTVTVNATGVLGTGTFTGGAACTQAP